MIDPVLKKFGLFDARRSVKNLTTSSNTKQTPKKPSTHTSKNHTMTLPVYKQSDSYTAPPKNKLQKLITFLKAHHNCPCKSHLSQGYRVKFVCLEQSCLENLGCAQCFLYKHCDHMKSQIGLCIRELEGVEKLMSSSFQMIVSHKLALQEQICKQIQMQIYNMHQEFEQSLEYLRNKAFKQVQQCLFSNQSDHQMLKMVRIADNVESESNLLSQLLKINIKQIEKDVAIQLKELSISKTQYMPLIRVFQEMNGALTHFLASFKKCMPSIEELQHLLSRKQKQQGSFQQASVSQFQAREVAQNSRKKQ